MECYSPDEDFDSENVDFHGDRNEEFEGGGYVEKSEGEETPNGDDHVLYKYEGGDIEESKPLCDQEKTGKKRKFMDVSGRFLGKLRWKDDVGKYGEPPCQYAKGTANWPPPLIPYVCEMREKLIEFSDGRQ